MLQLTPEQVDRLQALKRRRDLARLGQALASALPDLPSRLGDRFDAFVEHGVQRAARHGLTHLLCIARYLACWTALGAEFEARPAHAWAADLLGDLRRPQGAKAFQLCRRTREALAALAAPASHGTAAMTPALFDQAIAALDLALRDAGIVGSLVAPGRLQLGEACDVDAVDLRLAEPPSHQPYRLQGEAWLRSPLAAAPAAVTRVAGAAGDATAAPGPDAAAAGALPERLYLLGPDEGRQVAQLRVRVKAEHWCDSAVHPAVAYHGQQGSSEWRGPRAADLRIALPAEPIVHAGGDAPRPTIGAEPAARHGVLSIDSCALRPSGTPMGTLTTQLVVYPSAQFLLQWQRDPPAAARWPGADAAPLMAAPRAHVECDGVSWDATPWQLGLEALDQQLHDALGRLAVAWERVAGVTQGRLEAAPQLLCGRAGLTWGWAEGAEPLLAPPLLRIAGAIDLVACALDLRLTGRLQWHGSDSLLSLSCTAAEPLQLQFDRGPADADLAALLAPATLPIRLPFTLAVESLASDMLAVATPVGTVTGAVVGACGLRPRPDGAGWQWFAQLAIEPVQAVLQVHDPLLGARELLRPLLPAMTLVDWSLG